MKTIHATLAVATLAVLALPTYAADESALAGKSGCLACHAIDKKNVGPAYKDVAAKYKGNKGAEAMLVDKVKKGGQGVWGDLQMPPNGAFVKDADIKKLVEWILSLDGGADAASGGPAKSTK
jgi:cytochrome c